MSAVTDLAARVAEDAELDAMRALQRVRDVTSNIVRTDVAVLAGVAVFAQAYVAAIRAFEVAQRAPASDAVRVRWFEQLLGDELLEAADAEVTRHAHNLGEMQS